MDVDTLMENDIVPSSDEEDDNLDDRKHNQLLDAISSLDGKKRAKLSQRTVISNQISEFNFTSSKDHSSRIKLHELVGSLKETTNHGDLKKQLLGIEKNKDTVTTPLPKHEKEKLDRSTAYESTTQDISKWDPIVKKNRKAEQLEFPLQKQDFRIVTTDQFVKRFQPRTPLEQEVAALLRGSDNVIHDQHQELTVAEQRALKAMDLDEAKERRMELMKHRALLFYKEAKAKRQKKIKSKRYHKILKKERIKIEKKQLDKLKTDDPEEFLDKLNQMEKARAEERMSLKHRGAGKFAKRQALYAKYDDRARQEVQDMLQKSRELTKKVEVESDSDNEEMFPDAGVDEEEDDTEQTTLKTDTKNPWMAKPSRKRSGVLSASTGNEMNAEDDDDNDDNDSKYSRPQELKNEEIDANDSDSDNDNEDDNEKGDNVDFISLRNKKKVEVHDLSGVDTNDDNKNENILSKDVIDDIFDIKVAERKDLIPEKKKKMRHRKLKKLEKKLGTTEKSAAKSQNKTEDQSASEDSNDDDDDDDEDDDDVKVTVKKVSDNSFEAEMGEDSDIDETNNESLKRKKTLEDMDDVSDDNNGECKKIGQTKRQKLVTTTSVKNKKKQKSLAADSKKVAKETEEFVDPKKLFTLETKLRQTGSGPTIIDNDDNDDGDMDGEEQQRMTIAQAFADDDVIEEFTKEKGDAIEKGKPKAIDLTLPGWGSWVGEDMKVSAKKRKRFTIKPPPALPRKDEHLGHVIINEAKNTSVTKHQVHEIPFPYVNAEQFETSIRTPLGKTWNPETVHKALTKPRVVTHLGKVINPLNKSEVFKDKKHKSTPVIEDSSEKISMKKREMKGGNKGGKPSSKPKLMKKNRK